MDTLIIVTHEPSALEEVAEIKDMRFYQASVVAPDYEFSFEFGGHIQIITTQEFERRFGQAAPQPGELLSFHMPDPHLTQTARFLIQATAPGGVNVFIPCPSHQESETNKTRLIQAGYTKIVAHHNQGMSRVFVDRGDRV